MSKPKSTGEQILAAEIARALSYLKGPSTSAEKNEQLLEAQAPRLIQEAQLFREAVMLRQQCEVAEYVRDSIRADKAAGRPKTGLPLS